MPAYVLRFFRKPLSKTSLLRLTNRVLFGANDDEEADDANDRDSELQ